MQKERVMLRMLWGAVVTPPWRGDRLTPPNPTPGVGAAFCLLLTADGAPGGLRLRPGAAGVDEDEDGMRMRMPRPPALARPAPQPLPPLEPPLGGAGGPGRGCGNSPG